MKNLNLFRAFTFLIAMTVLSPVASASWFQENCSSADGRFAMGQGHNENFIQWTLREYGIDSVKETVMKDEDGNLHIQVIKDQELVKESERACVPGQSYGFASWREVSYRQIEVRMADGSLFPKTAVGVSADQKTLNFDILCELNGNSEMMCQ